MRVVHVRHVVSQKNSIRAEKVLRLTRQFLKIYISINSLYINDKQYPIFIIFLIFIYKNNSGLNIFYFKDDIYKRIGHEFWKLKTPSPMNNSTLWSLCFQVFFILFLLFQSITKSTEASILSRIVTKGWYQLELLNYKFPTSTQQDFFR